MGVFQREKTKSLDSLSEQNGRFVIHDILILITSSNVCLMILKHVSSIYQGGNLIGKHIWTDACERPSRFIN